MEIKMQKAFRLIISGQVQGVGYRRWFYQQAQALALKGYVKNLATGEVEALVITDAENLSRVIELAYLGPPHAEVHQVNSCEVSQDLDVTDFQIIRE
jgi:acylphosphatase